MRLAPVLAGAIVFLGAAAHAADAGDARALVAVARHGVEVEDSRATGHLIRVDASGSRISNAFAVRAHWFPGVLRVLLQVDPSQTAPSQAAVEGTRPKSTHEERISILFEMRPNGQSTIRVFRPHESAPASLPFDKWGESVDGSDFNYEDFLQPEYYWQNQTVVNSAKFGAHNCDVLKSAPGASDRSHYAEVQTWLDHTTGYPIYVEKTLKGAGTVKGFTSLGLRQMGGVWSARQVEIKIQGRPGSTLLIFERGSTKANLTLKDFSPEQISHAEDRP